MSFKHKGSFWKAHHFWGVEEQVQPGFGRWYWVIPQRARCRCLGIGATSFFSLVQISSLTLLSKRPRVAHAYHNM